MPAADPRRPVRRARAAGLLAGFLADAVLGDPARWHPVAGFGTVAGALERRWYADRRPRGAAYTALLVGTTALAGTALGRGTRHRPVLHAGVTAAATWTVVGGTSLAREAARVHAHLAAGDLDAGRTQVSRLVGRDPSSLDAAGVARATVESVAENTADAVVAPLFWGAVAGPAGLLGYRAANTLDAMVGHRSPRYASFGWASARSDDLLNLVPARLTALLAAATAPAAGPRPAEEVAVAEAASPARGGTAAALRAWARDAHRHPSPNAGPVEAAFAGALGVTLGGVNSYRGVVEDRGALGTGPRAGVPDIPRAVRLARAVNLAAAVLTATAAGAASPPWRRRR